MWEKIITKLKENLITHLRESWKDYFLEFEKEEEEISKSIFVNALRSCHGQMREIMNIFLKYVDSIVIYYITFVSD
jgi:hypothetical protein